MNGEVPRFIWRALRSRFRDHRAELAAFQRHIRPGDIVCDVGANKGSFLFWLSKWSGRAVAFEPQQDLAAYLSRMCASTGLQNVTVEAKAVYSHATQMELFIPDGHKPGASLTRSALAGAMVEAVTVPVVALDDYFGQHELVSALKIDVEGAEMGVFEGADRILRKDKPLLVFECEGRNLDRGSVSDVISHLERIGYRGAFVDRGSTKPVSTFQESLHQRRDSEWFWKQPGYCHNFIFTAVS